MGCAVSRRSTVDLRVESYRSAGGDDDGGGANGARSLTVTVKPSGTAARKGGPPSLGTLEAKHTSLAEDWEKQKQLVRQTSRERGVDVTSPASDDAP